MVADADIALVQAGYEAFVRGDIDAAVAGLSPDVEWIEPDEFPMGGRRVGREAVHEYLSASRTGWSELHSEREVTRRGRDLVVVHTVAGRMADGSEGAGSAVDVYTVEDGMVVRMQAYADLADVADIG